MSGDGRLMIAGCQFDYSTTVVQKLATDAENYNFALRTKHWSTLILIKITDDELPSRPNTPMYDSENVNRWLRLEK